MPPVWPFRASRSRRLNLHRRPRHLAPGDCHWCRARLTVLYHGNTFARLGTRHEISDYWLIGADDKGAERDVIIEADDETTAVARAKQHGISAYTVSPYEDPQRNSVVPSTGVPYWKPEAQRERDETLIRALVLVGCAGMVLLGCTGIFKWLAAPPSFKPNGGTTAPVEHYFAGDAERLEWRSRASSSDDQRGRQIRTEKDHRSTADDRGVAATDRPIKTPRDA